MEHHGTPWNVMGRHGTKWGKMIPWKAVSIATFKISNYPPKNPECEIAYTPYLKVVGIISVQAGLIPDNSLKISSL